MYQKRYIGHYKLIDGIWTLPEKLRHFVFPKRFLCFWVRVKVRVRVRARVEVIGLELAEIYLNTFTVKRPFGQVYYEIPLIDTTLVISIKSVVNIFSKFFLCLGI